MGLLRTVRFDNIFSFMYSSRPNTAAAGFTDQVPVEVRSRRLQALQEEQKEITTERSRALVGKTLDVLVEGSSKAGTGELMGRTGCSRMVNFPAPGWTEAGPGSIISVTMTDAYSNSLRGEARKDCNN